MQRDNRGRQDNRKSNPRLNFAIAKTESEALKVNTGVTNYRHEKFNEQRITQHRNLKDKVRKYIEDEKGQLNRQKLEEERLATATKEIDQSKTLALNQMVV